MAATIHISSSAGGEWDEARLNAALARLQEMHIQLRDLRSTIPCIIKPMLDSHSSPEGLYNEFSHSAMAAAKDVRSFADLMDDGENKAVLERAKKRRSESEDGITTWRVTEHEDWLDHKDATLGAQDHDEAQDDDMIDTEDTNGQDKDPRVVTALFKEDYPEIIADMDETTKVIEVVLPPPGRIHFTIETKPDPQGQTTFQISCKESSRLHAAMLRCISTRPRSYDLRYLLEMLAAYRDVKSQPCARCGKLLDGQPQFPVVRESKRTKAADGRFEEIWDGFHEACA